LSAIAKVGLLTEEGKYGKRWWMDFTNGETITANTLDDLLWAWAMIYEKNGYWLPRSWENKFEKLDQRSPFVKQTNWED
jgi:hypothetical protein